MINNNNNKKEVIMTKEKKLRFTLNRHNIEHRKFLEKAYQEGFQ